jgi:hypothetical protein
MKKKREKTRQLAEAIEEYLSQLTPSERMSLEIKLQSPDYFQQFGDCLRELSALIYSNFKSPEKYEIVSHKFLARKPIDDPDLCSMYHFYLQCMPSNLLADDEFELSYIMSRFIALKQLISFRVKSLV